MSGVDNQNFRIWTLEKQPFMQFLSTGEITCAEELDTGEATYTAKAEG